MPEKNLADLRRMFACLARLGVLEVIPLDYDAAA